MDVVDEELFAIETISSRTQFLMNKPSERPNPAMHPVMDKKNSEDIDMELCNKRRYTSGRRRILGEEHKQFLLNYIDENPSAVVNEVVESLKQNFEGLNVSRSTVYNFMTTRCATSANGLINISLRVPKHIKKRKLGHVTDGYSTGTVTGFVKATLDEMDKYPEMKGHYLIMDNAPIHNSADIGKYINSREYRFVYLPPYSHELNPIEQFWSVVKMKHEIVCI
ncbi:hypothetical protein G6F56_004600 [Rhizopus delemar]|nr:hypothetical protein G6F56_004600 [Rhizopus delemar]